MKIKSILISALCALTFASCSKDGEKVPTGDGETNVKVQLSEGVAPQGRASTSPVGDGAAVTLNHGHLFFVNGSNQLTKVVQIVTDGSGDMDTKVNYSSLTVTGGATLTKVPESSSKIYFFGNLPAIVTIPPVSSDMNVFLTTTLDIATQKDASGGVTNVALYGEGAISGSGSSHTAAFTVCPIVSRIELAKLEIDATGVMSDDGATPSEIDSFEVEGIFVNWFYSASKVGGTVADANLVQYTSMSNWTDGGETYFSAPYTGLLYDYDLSGIGTFADPNYTPATPGHVWAYNVFAGGAVPHVIVRLGNVVVDGTPLTGSRFITITGFADANDDTPLTTIKGGEIYTIASLAVHEDKLTEVPEIEGEISVNVDVTMMNWKEVPVNPIVP